ncbi:MAG: DEAD/DEAH box helicase [Myxococcota bacterium]
MSAKHSIEVLSYWSALLKYQEALSARPRARRIEPNAFRTPNVQQPAQGRDYVKLPFAGASEFFLGRGSFEPLPLDAERTEFFENWLVHRYRRGDADESEIGELVLFPAIQLAREELGGILRFPVEVEWWREGQQFRAPPAEERAKGHFPEPPTELRLVRPSREPDEVLPFFLDAGLLQRELRVEPEDLDALFVHLRRMREVSPAAMIEAICKLLEAPLDGERAATADPKHAATTHPTTPTALVARFFEVAQRRCQALGGRSRCYPVGLVVSTERVRATYHVQRDIAQAISSFTEGSLDAATPLVSYVEGRSPELVREPCLGRWPGACLTDNQREALELGLGSQFCAVQGPPGTGKTRLILEAVAHQLVEKARGIANGGQPKQTFLMVTSTNNRAVDNVIDPLGSGAYSDFPLALRLGSREVTSTVTARTLTRVLSYVERVSEVSEERFEKARREFSTKFERIENMLRPERRRAEAERANAQRETEIASLEARVREAERGHDAPDSELGAALRQLFGQVTLNPEQRARYRDDPGGARRDVSSLIQALAKLSRDAESDGPVALKRIEVGFRRVVRKSVPLVERWFGGPLALGLPPAAAAGARVATSDWEDGLERSIGALLSLEAAVGALESYSRDRARLEQLRVAAANSPSLPEEPIPDESERSDAFAELTQSALELRDLWLRRNQREIRDSLRLAIAACTRSRSLRAFLDATSGAGLWLRRLFPCFGCTLLSLGNAFGGEQPAFERVIVDEAGQCHPAYVVSALLRARSALVIGDVHQLEPVIGLSQEDERRIFRGMKLKISETEMQPYRTYDGSGNSAQSLAERAVPSRPALRDHFRCQAEIALLSDTWCNYGLVPRAARASCQPLVPELVAPVLLTQVRGEQERYLGSFRNRVEAIEVASWLEHLLASGLNPAEIAVITPYRGQSEHLLQTLRSASIPVERPRDELLEEASLELFDAASAAVAVGTVHRFQGGERRVVLFSTTVTRPESLGFIDERVHLLNVATSRAKEHLIVVGNAATLRQGRHTRALVESATKLAQRGGA